MTTTTAQLPHLRRDRDQEGQELLRRLREKRDRREEWAEELQRNRWFREQVLQQGAGD